MPEAYSKLEQAARVIVLPEPLCKLIEAIGAVTLDNGVSVAPYAPTDKQLHDTDFFPNYGDLLMLAKGDAAQNDAVALDWAACNLSAVIDPEVIYNYIAGTSRGYRANIMFRKVAYDETGGKGEFLVTTEKLPGGICGITPQRMEEVTARTGAIYSFRTDLLRPKWFAGRDVLPALCATEEFEYAYHTADLCSTTQITH